MVAFWFARKEDTSSTKEKVFALMNAPYNASSIHKYGREARALLEEARSTILHALGDKCSKNYDLIFTSSGTEANNLLVKGFSDHHLLLSSIEHASLMESAACRDNVTFLPVDEDGLLKLDALEHSILSISNPKKIVSVMLANNETGVIQNLQTISEIARNHGALVHTDAVQAFGKIDVNASMLGVDLMTISAHKMGGVFGAAALVKRKNIQIAPLLHGGKQEQGLKPGTHNLFAILGFAEAVRLIPTLLVKYAQLRELRDSLEDQILTFAPEAKVYSKNCDRLPTTTCIAMPGMSSEAQLINFDLDGFAVSAGSACSSGKIELSHVLRAMGVEEGLARNAIRISLGLTNTELEAQKFVAAWRELYFRARVTASHPSTSALHAYAQGERNYVPVRSFDKLRTGSERSEAKSKDERSLSNENVLRYI